MSDIDLGLLDMIREDLPIAPLVQPDVDQTDLSIQERFDLFHAANPWVLDALERLTADYLASGQERLGIRMLWEVLRWRYNRATQDPTSSFKVNDHYHSRYVRLLVDRHPGWASAFHTRALRAA